MFDAGRRVRSSVVRSTGAVQQSTRVWVILRRVDEADRVYFVLTACPCRLAMMRRYADFRAFFGGWFHQDYHDEGDSVDEVVAAFGKSATIDDIRPIRNDIATFLRDHEDPIDDAFDREFQPDVDPRAFSETTRAFLGAIDRALTAV